MTIEEIRALTQKELETLRIKGKAELLNIKEHDCYFTDLEGAFGYSVLVFKNNHHIYYANDYQLHHKNKTKEDLKQWYINILSNKPDKDQKIKNVDTAPKAIGIKILSAVCISVTPPVTHQ